MLLEWTDHRVGRLDFAASERWIVLGFCALHRPGFKSESRSHSSAQDSDGTLLASGTAKTSKGTPKPARRDSMISLRDE
jgi:hypothetical protein